MLFVPWEPSAVFDDRFICMPAQINNLNNDMNIEALILNNVKAITNSGNKIIIQAVKTNYLNVQRNLQKNLLSEAKISIYPNPASDHIIIEYDCENDGIFVLYNSVGQMVLHTQLEKGKRKVQVAIGNISNGFYHYKCSISGCTEEVGKLNVQH